MDIEKRVDALEQLAFDSATEVMASEMLFRVLIATHPDPQLLAKVLEALLSERMGRMRDVGFERGYLPSTAQATSAAIEQRVQAWIQVLRAQTEG